MTGTMTAKGTPIWFSLTIKKRGNAVSKISKVRSVELLACDAGWRNYHFVKLTTEDGIIGWSEFDEGFGSPGVGAAIQRHSARVVGQNAFQHERIYAELFASTRPAVSLRKRLARSKTPCSTRKQNCSVCPATSCSAAKFAIAFASTGRIAPPGASTVPTGTSRRSPISTASRRSDAKSAKRSSPR